MSDSSVESNHVGLALTGSERVVIDQVEVTGSAEAGVLLHGDTRTRITGLGTDANGGDGLRISGGGDRTVTEVVARRNKGFGVSAAGSPGLVPNGTQTGANGEGGVHLSSCSRCRLEDPGAADEPIAVQITGSGSASIRVLEARIRGGTTGVQATRTASGTRLTGLAIRSAAVSTTTISASTPTTRTA
ncbi:right-handed parallel beta-helix repeat-containing protein [Nonomuraea terrae]|uniref:right-handed parallel beta-helix repeat-containing protein n=1 Tax=Nonomuraea terrae TaxID=2530383 RepID=UPI0037A1A2BD